LAGITPTLILWRDFSKAQVGVFLFLSVEGVNDWDGKSNFVFNKKQRQGIKEI